MRRLILSQAAKADLREIWRYGVDQWGDAQADRYARDLDKAFAAVCQNPLRGTACEDVRPGFRRYRCRSHVIFFHRRGDDVRIARVLHERMDFSRHL